ncbi:MAG: methylated-DNA--[protein]-cysteine S-methyltransferase [Planctomycetota bacterium]
MNSFAYFIDSPFGKLVLRAKDESLCECRRADGVEVLEPVARSESAVLREAGLQLARYFEGELRAFDLPIAQPGTPFQQEVWQALLGIPFADTVTYAQLAERIGRDASSSRAVGSANGANKVAIVVPCHRVVPAVGGVGGYAGGSDMKAALLQHEGSHTPLFTMQSS